jgi:hypothetical protein
MLTMPLVSPRPAPDVWHCPRAATLHGGHLQQHCPCGIVMTPLLCTCICVLLTSVSSARMPPLSMSANELPRASCCTM